MATVAVLIVPAALFPLASDPNVAGLMLGVFLVLGFTIAAAALALTLIVIPAELRGVNFGISLVVGSLFFVGLAPLQLVAYPVPSVLMIAGSISLACGIQMCC